MSQEANATINRPCGHKTRVQCPLRDNDELMALAACRRCGWKPSEMSIATVDRDAGYKGELMLVTQKSEPQVQVPSSDSATNTGTAYFFPYYPAQTSGTTSCAPGVPAGWLTPNSKGSGITLEEAVLSQTANKCYVGYSDTVRYLPKGVCIRYNRAFGLEENKAKLGMTLEQAAVGALVGETASYFSKNLGGGCFYFEGSRWILLND